MNPFEQNTAQTTNDKEPWLAVNLSKILPGIGQIYAGKPLKGLIILLSYFLLIGIGIWQLIDNVGNAPVGFAALAIAFLILPIWNFFDAHASARRGNSVDFEAIRKQNKDPWLAVFLSSFIPGLGHAYLNQWVVSLLFFVIFVVVSLVVVGARDIAVLIIAGLTQLGFPLFVLYNTYVSAPVRRERSRRTIILFIAGLFGISTVLSAVVAVLIRLLIAEARYIPSGAMEPTLQVNDRVLVNKLAYRFSSPQRGDLVVFSPTEALQQQGFTDAFIKRIVGLPGEQVAIRDGKVLINNQPLSEPYLDSGVKTAVDLCEPLMAAFLAQPVTVPPNAYLMMGDNRNNSFDSRCWGFVPRENIIGKATQRFYPFDRAGSLVGK
jgi:signal peptidase I